MVRCDAMRQAGRQARHILGMFCFLFSCCVCTCVSGYCYSLLDDRRVAVCNNSTRPPPVAAVAVAYDVYHGGDLFIRGEADATRCELRGVSYPEWRTSFVGEVGENSHKLVLEEHTEREAG